MTEALTGADLLALSTIVTTVVTFLAGFSSVRVHAHHDRAVARYESLVDRLVDIARTSSSFPRPRELHALSELFDDELKLDLAAKVTPWLCTGVAGFSVAIIATARSTAAFMAEVGVEQAAVYGAGAIGILVALLAFVNFLTVRAALSRERSQTLPSIYDTALQLASDEDEPMAAGQAFEEVIGKLPGWGWGMLAIAGTLKGSADLVETAYRADLCEGTIRKVKDSQDPVNRALLARAYLLTDREVLASPIIADLRPLCDRYAEVNYLLSDAFPGVEGGLQALISKAGHATSAAT